MFATTAFKGGKLRATFKLGDLWNEDGAPRVAVDRSGKIVIGDERGAQRASGQRMGEAPRGTII